MRIDSRHIAVVGMAFRFPGGLMNEDALWEVLKQGKTCIGQIPQERWPTDTLRHIDRAEPGRSVTFSAGILPDIDQFDAGFFSISPREAVWLDPQQRLLLEMSYEAMENAGIPSQSLAGSCCGVYVGMSSLDYGLYGLEDLASMSSHSMTGNTLSVAANRISYFFDLRGPSLAIDTACSSSLAALHYACTALREGRMPLALAGGVNILMHPYSFVGFSQAHMLGASGACLPFDERADGYVRSEGGAVLLLKPLSRAMEDKDDIQAVILASGVNADGKRKTGITMPSREGQAELMRKVLADAGIHAHDVDFIEAHGTGTAIGDPVEAKAIGEVYGRGRSRPLPIGSVKANLGHLEPASGMAGMVKAILALKRRALPPVPFAFSPNGHIDFKGLNVRCLTEYTPLRQSGAKPLVAGVNSFGFGGANAHVLLREFIPEKNSEPASDIGAPAAPPPLFLSARGGAALKDLAQAYAQRIEQATHAQFYNIAYTAAFHRNHLETRLALAASSPAEAARALRNFATGAHAAGLYREDALPQGGDTAFIYSGNGAQWAGMAKNLLKQCPDFARILQELDADMLGPAGFSVLAALGDAEAFPLEETAVSQPLLFAIQAALTIMLRELGVRPGAAMGHSVGEIAAAWACGALDMGQAIRVICARSQAQSLTAGLGRMAVAALSEQDMHMLLQTLGLAEDVEVSCVNSPSNVTVSGSRDSLNILQNHLEARGMLYRLMDLNYAFHSRRMDGIRNVLAEKLQGLTPSESDQAAFISSVTGRLLPGTALGADYWWDNIREPVRFSAAMDALLQRGCGIFVEIGPHAVLQRYIRDCAKAAGKEARVIPTMLRNDDRPSRIAEAALRAHMAAGDVDPRAFFPREGRRVSLPNYPWRKERYWHRRTSEGPLEKRREHPLLGWPLDCGEPAWENVLDPAAMPWLCDHKVGGAVVFPAAGYVEMALAAGRAWLGESPFSLESLDIAAPLVFDGGTAQSLRLILSARDGSFRIAARPRLGGGPWMPHATGRIMAAPLARPLPAIAPVGENGRPMEGAELYACALAHGLDYGPVFRRVARLNIAEDRLEAELKAQDFAAGSGFLLHPALLDACFHSLLSLYATRGEMAPMAYLPVKTGQVTVFSRETVRTVRVRVSRRGLRSLEADCELLDVAGSLAARARACRFRAAQLAPRKKSPAGLWRGAALLKPAPHTESTAATPALEELVAVLERDFSQWEEERRAWFERALPLLEATALGFAFKAFRALDGESMQDRPRGLSSPYFKWLAKLLQQEKLLEIQDGGRRITSVTDFPDPHDLWHDLLREHPQSLPELLLVGRAGMRLEHILRGRLSGAAVHAEIFAAPVAGELRDSGPAFAGTNRAVNAILQPLAHELPQERRLRVLELGWRPGNAAEVLLERLAADRCSLVLACCDAEALSAEVSRYAQSGAVSGLTLDVGSWSVQGGWPQHSFDVVIVNHVLHRAANPLKALADIKKRLAPGGLLLLAERHADWSACLAQGLDESWWSGGGEIPLRAPQTWRRLVEESGFAPCRIFTEPAAGELNEGAYLLLAKRPMDSPRKAMPAIRSWLLAADAGSLALAAALQQRLAARGQQAFIHSGESDSAPDNADNIVFMRGAQDSPDAVADTLNDLLHCARRAARRKDGPARMWIVTRGGALCAEPPASGAPSCGLGAPSPAQCALWGAGRVIMNEYVDLNCTLIDASAALPPELAAERLEGEFLFPDGADEIMLSPSGRHVLALEAVQAPGPGVSPAKSATRIVDVERRIIGSETSATGMPIARPAEEERFRLDFNTPGRLRNLAWFADAARAVAEGEIEARVLAVGLNFRDVMLTMGLLPDDAVENGFAGPTLGLEFSGIVTRVGQGVEHIKPGDAVVGFAPSCFASHVLTPARAVAALPAGWSHEDAAAVPTVFFTAWYALNFLARMQPGERLLAHGAAGGVGLASIQIARHLGLEVFATAGSEEKRDFIRLQGVEHVFDSRGLGFAEEILERTGGEGVDAVLNSLAGEPMRRSLSLLRPFGRFLELGKRDFVENTPVGVRPFKENISYFAIDADQLLTGRPQLAGRIFQEVMGLFHKGVLNPLTRRCFTAGHVADAFRSMQQSRHVGKIVVSLAEPPALDFSSVNQASEEWRTGGAWLVTGGMSGFGLSTAKWLAERGAERLVLAGRRGMASPAAQDIAREFAARGVAVSIEACDVADANAVRELMRRIQLSLPPLRGIVHAAAVYDDRLIAGIDAQSLKMVLEPKLSGAWRLHEASKNMPIEHFVLYSSVSVALGNPGQANYAAANAGLEGLAALRRRMGLPATCIAWGPVDDVGYLSRNEKVKKSLEQCLGGPALSSDEALRRLGEILAAGGGAYTLANVEWGSVRRMLPHAEATRYSMVLRGAKDTHVANEAHDIHDLIAGKAHGEAMDIVCALLMGEVAHVLSLNVERVHRGCTLQALGMDSLMAVELAVSLERRFGVRLPAMMLQDCPTIEKVAARVMDRLAGKNGEAQDDGGGAVELARKHGEEIGPDDAAAMQYGARREDSISGERA